MSWYEEPETTGAPHRERYLAQLLAYLEREQARARPSSAPADSAPGPRERFLGCMGWPMTLPRPAEPPSMRMQFVAEDDLGLIFRVWVETLPGLETYGVYFQPRSQDKVPLVIAQHGGWGTPEICSGLHASANYNNMARRAHARGAAVLAPQLLMWRDIYGPVFDRAEINRRLRGLGGTITGLEVWQLQRCLDAFIRRPEVDTERVGMVGLSYGGYYTQFLAAADERIRAGINSCFLLDPRNEHTREIAWIEDDPDFGFGEMMALIAPRAFYLETGQTDDIIPAVNAPQLVAVAREVYAALGAAERFAYKNHPGWHEFDPADDGLDFLFRFLRD